MKTMIIILTVLATYTQVQKAQELAIKAIFISSNDGIYTFVDDDGMEYEFSDIDTKVYKKFNLDSDEFIGKRFRVTYDLDYETDENDEEYDVYIIVGLDLIN